MGEISRRAMLGGTGKLAVVAGAGTRLGRRPPAAAGLGKLARQLRGRLLRPGDRGYLVASVPYNKRYADIRPGGVAMCADAADVRTALRWARRYRMPFAARSGAHSYGGYSASRGLIISLATMDSVRVDRGSMTIRVGAGTRIRDFYAALAGTGVAAATGRCPSVGLSGLLLGGGFGFTSRHLGLTCDSLLETEVVTASGAILRVSPIPS